MLGILRNIRKIAPANPTILKLPAREVNVERAEHYCAPNTLFEEETLPHYRAEEYYPVHIGDVLNVRYRVAGKLGYGAYSTNWLCRDMDTTKYIIIKVSTSLRKFPTATHRELKVYEHLAKVESLHPGQSLIRELYDLFELKGPEGKHQCLVQQPMHLTVLQMMNLNTQPFNLPLLKMTVKRILYALDFLHTEASVIHTGIQFCSAEAPNVALTNSP
ncbi:non-specific serine/threonine protein kinase [Madurella fahalii]|uniref:non-specific serine/threonine protein kinase n=1 Tax=Madurella fahalii TaxID=1157608 RepID=A0ABQ0GLB7_9PEZI